MYSMSRAPRFQAKSLLVQATRTTPPPDLKRERIDWDGMRRNAYLLGILPPDPAMFDPRRQRRLAMVLNAVKDNDIKRLMEVEIKEYNSSMKVLGRYRDICVIALQARRRLKTDQ